MIKSKTMRPIDSRYGGSAFTQYSLHKESKCAQCGKKFLRTGEHVYQRKDGNLTLWYCSYTCFRVKAKEDEKKEREKFEKSLKMLDLREMRNREYERRKREIKRAGKDERVACRSLEEARARLEEAEKKIEEYGAKYLEAEPGSYDRTLARRNMTRWERKRKYLREEVEHFKKKEMEA